MRKYTIYFEIYGKKMKAYVNADSEKYAKNEIFKKIIFHKIVPIVEKINDEQVFASLKDIFKMK